MSAPLASLRAWARERGAPDAGALLTKRVPCNVSWAHTLGSLLLVYLGFQVLTGILLGLYYNPSPENALASVEYVRDELFAGRLVLAMHRQGAAFVLVTALLHLARVYFTAAYKQPRELLWLSGLALGVLLTLFAFTGQLLPFDQRGFWATVVGLRIASSAPVLGGYVHELLTGGYGDIGATTLSRFYVLHVSVLPLVLVSLGGLHLSILQRVGPAGPLAGSPVGTRPFHPSQTARDVTVAALGALALVAVAAWTGAETTGPADPSVSGFTPRPEWYFYAHYELLRLFPGRLEVIPTFVLPNLLFALLIALPFLDRRPERLPARRPLAVGAGVLFLLALVGLTARGLAERRAEERARPAGAAAQDPVAHGAALFREKGCVRCHSIAGEGGTKGPPLDGVSQRLRADFLPRWIRRPSDTRPGTEMPAFEGTEAELSDLVRYLRTL